MRRLAVLLAAIAIGVWGAGCGGSDDESTQAVSLPTLTAPAAPQTQSTTTPSATTTTSAAPKNPERSQAAPEPSSAAQPACPPQLTKSDCRALAQGGSGSKVTDEDSCPAGMSRSECEELYREIKRGGSRVGLPDCSQLGPELCEELLGKQGH